MSNACVSIQEKLGKIVYQEKIVGDGDKIGISRVS